MKIGMSFRPKEDSSSEEEGSNTSIVPYELELRPYTVCMNAYIDTIHQFNRLTRFYVQCLGLESSGAPYLPVIETFIKCVEGFVCGVNCFGCSVVTRGHGLSLSPLLIEFTDSAYEFFKAVEELVRSVEVFTAGVANEDIFNKTYSYGLEHYSWAVELLANDAATTILFNVMCYVKYHHWI